MAIDLILHNFGERYPTVKCLDHGSVTLVDLMPRLSDHDNITTADFAVLEAARISHIKNKEEKSSPSKDRGLIRYLMRQKHSSPFEMIEFKWHHKLPIFVARQLVRHRTVSLNEMSGRYSKLPNEFYIPESVRQQSKNNKQGSYGSVDPVTAAEFLDYLESAYSDSYSAYEKAIEGKVGNEIARIGLPVALYTEWVWKINLHNLLHFLMLRSDSHAQSEIQVYSNAMLGMVAKLCPLTVEAWEDFDPYRGAVVFSALEMEAMKQRKNSTLPKLNERATGREQDEWLVKANKLGFEVV